MVADKPHVLIIGAGIAGLTAAHTLHSSAPDSFHIRIAEASHRLGGRIHTSTFSDVLVELGATWIHGIAGSPVHDIAIRIGAFENTHVPHECMDGQHEDPVTALPGGDLVDPVLDRSIFSLYHSLIDLARSGPPHPGPSLGHFLHHGLRSYRDSTLRTVTSPISDRTLDSLEDALFSMHENLERIHTSVPDLDLLDLAAESEYCEFPGEHVTIPQGYSRVIEHIASGLPEGTVVFGKRVERIEWARDGREPPVHVQFDDGEVARAHHVIVTVSLGVLKADRGIVFDPELPEPKRGAVQRLGFGVVNKLFMEWEPEEGGVREFPYLHMAIERDRPASEGVPRWMHRSPAIWPVYPGAKVLLAWFAGDEAVEMEEIKDDEIVWGANAAIVAFMPRGGGRVRRVERSRWGMDPLFMGSYCYVAVGSSGNDLDRMAEPLPLGGGPGRPFQVLFAGEATHRTHYSTTHGAYFSGVREGNRLLRHYNLISKNEEE